MSTPTAPGAPAFPLSVLYGDGVRETDRGLTKRELLAALALQGMLSYPGCGHVERVTATAVRCADALIAALNKETTDAPLSP